MGRRATPEAAERAVQEADLWRDYRDAFQSLADEQRAFVRAMQKGDRRLRAYCSYNSDMTPLESQLVEQGLACLLYRLESGTWQLGEGPNEDLKARFEALATRAGIALHTPHDIAARDFWLHHLCLHLRRTGNKGFFGGTDTGGYIEDVCQTSATFCSWLERKALEVQRTSPETGASKPKNKREAFVMPILGRKGWSIHEWAVESRVDFHTANNYLKGKTRSYRSTRKKLADSLDVEVEKLPE